MRPLNGHPLRGVTAGLLCLLLSVPTPAFSAEAVKPASETVVRAAPEAPDAKAEAAAASKAVAEKAPADAAAKPAEKSAPKPLPHIALILPTGSKAFGKVAESVRLGFAAGAEAEGRNAFPHRVYNADDDTTALAREVRRATAEGAVMLVGGVTRDGAAMLARENSALPALALNAPALAEAELPERFFHVSLSLDHEARLAARSAATDGVKRIAIAAGASPLARRIQDSFEKEWFRVGGEVAARIAISTDLAEGEKVQRALEKTMPDGIFIAADTRVARVARPWFTQGIPVYATSMTIDPRADAVENLDLDGVRFLEMPWFVELDHPAVMAFAKPAEPLPIDYERLYALGIDAWRLTQQVLKAGKPREVAPLDGVTGKITLDGRQFVRTLSAVELRDGRISLRGTGE